MMSLSDFKFYLTFLTSAILIWRASAWVSRKQARIERFIEDVGAFMKSTSLAMNRIETNHLAHQERYLKAIAKASSVLIEEDFDASQE